jgi:hypothetical protein
MTQKTLLAILLPNLPSYFDTQGLTYILYPFHCDNLVKCITPYISYVQGSILGKSDMVRSKNKIK